MSAEYQLKTYIQRCLDERIAKKFTKRALVTAAEGDSSTVERAIAEWADRRVLRVLKPWRDCVDNDFCIEMLDYIDRPRQWPDWP